MRRTGKPARVGKPICQPGPVPILPPKRTQGFPDRVPGPSSHILAAPDKAMREGEDNRMPFVLLAILPVLALVLLLFAVFLAVRRWL